MIDDLTNLNLGQLVGRALYGELPRKPQPALVEAAEVALRDYLGLRSGEIAATLGIKTGLASAHLCTLSGVVKSGVRGWFVFRLKQPY